MNSKAVCNVGALLATGIAGIATGQFQGPYDPANWTITNPVGGSIRNDGVTLIVTGGDVSIGGNIDYTIMAAASGIWSFNWNYDSMDYASWDNGGYLLNGSFVELGSPGDDGKSAIPVNFGDIIGYRVSTVDGIFGPGILTIDRFYITPGPAGAAPFGVAALLSRRSRRRRT